MRSLVIMAIVYIVLGLFMVSQVEHISATFNERHYHNLSIGE